MSPTDVRTKQSIAALTITVVIALLWTVMPHPILIVAVCFAPLALLFVLNQTFLARDTVRYLFLFPYPRSVSCHLQL